MRIAVVAAGGRSGQAFVELALLHGHNVNAGVHGKNHLAPHSKLTVIPCDATRESDVAQLLKGQQVVASFIGHVKGSKANVQTTVMQTTLQMMSMQSEARNWGSRCILLAFLRFFPSSLSNC